MKKIEAMHNVYGKDAEHKCKECCNLSAYSQNRTWHKCEMYGISSSEATDWAKSSMACGKFNIPFDANKNVPLIKKLKHEPRIDEPLPGQLTLL